MAEKKYPCHAGIVVFDVTERKAAGQTVRDVTFKAIPSEKKIKVTVWDRFSDVPVEKGDFVVVEGEFEAKNVNGKEYYNMSPTMFLSFAPKAGGAKPAEAVEVDGGLEDDEEDLLF